MHFEILVEDASGKTALDLIVPRILGDDHTFNVHSYKGIGRIPVNLNPNQDPKKRILLNQLPRLISGYGKTFSSYPEEYRASLFIVCDLDDRSLGAFRSELVALAEDCHPRPPFEFCLAIEEGEAWFLGDKDAIKKAFPKAKDSILNAYTNDSICGTWEKLADAVYPGGAKALQAEGWQRIGAEKSRWASLIAPHMSVDANLSPSFEYFKQRVRSHMASS